MAPWSGGLGVSGEEAGWGLAEKEAPGRGAGSLVWTLDGKKAKLNVGAGSHRRGGLLQPACCHHAKWGSRGDRLSRVPQGQAS